jgi:hypothetical protein
MRLVDI